MLTIQAREGPSWLEQELPNQAKARRFHESRPDKNKAVKGKKKKKKDEDRVTQPRGKPSRRQKKAFRSAVGVQTQTHTQKKKYQEKIHPIPHSHNSFQPITIQIPRSTTEQRSPTLRNFPANWVPDLRSFFFSTEPRRYRPIGE